MNKKEILSQIREYDGFKKDAKRRKEFSVVKYYEKKLKELWNNYTNSNPYSQC